MYKGTQYSNRLIKRRQQQRLLQIHKQNLKGIRPITQYADNDNIFDPANVTLNNKKKDMLQQDRFTQIQRQNRMLLQKINSIMSKKSNLHHSIQKVKRKQSIQIINEKDINNKMNKSLNQGFRKKQLEGIQIQNAKLLKRLQQKKSDYDSKKLKQQWKQQKKVIKNVANYPFIIRDKIYKSRRKSTTSQSFHLANGYPYKLNPTNFSSPVQLVRIRNLNGQNFLLTIKFDYQTGLQIMGDNKSTKQIKIIQIPKQQAIQFIQYECNGKLQQLFDCLKYDNVAKVLFLCGKGVDIENKDKETQQDEDKNIRQQKNKQQNIENEQLENLNENSQKEEILNGKQDNKNLSNIIQEQAEQSNLPTQHNKHIQINVVFTQQKLNNILSHQQKLNHILTNSKQQLKQQRYHEQKLKQTKNQSQIALHKQKKLQEIPQQNLNQKLQPKLQQKMQQILQQKQDDPAKFLKIQQIKKQ